MGDNEFDHGGGWRRVYQYYAIFGGIYGTYRPDCGYLLGLDSVAGVWVVCEEEESVFGEVKRVVVFEVRFYRCWILVFTSSFRSVATDRGVLYVLMVRSNEQQLRRAFLVYCFLLRMQEKQLTYGKAWGKAPTLLNCVSLEPHIFDWLHSEVGLTHFKSFNVDSAVNLLEQFGVVIRGTEDMSPRLCSLQPVPMKRAIETLLQKRVDSFLGSVDKPGNRGVNRLQE